MDELSPLRMGFLRIHVRLPRGQTFTPGDIAGASGVPLDQLGPITVDGGEALVDVMYDSGRTARSALEIIGPTRLMDVQWCWLKLNVGRNHGLTIGQLRRLLEAADAHPLGKISINNTHSLVGLQDFKLPGVLERMGALRVNGYAAKPEALPLGKGPGPAIFIPDRSDEAPRPARRRPDGDRPR